MIYKTPLIMRLSSDCTLHAARGHMPTTKFEGAVGDAIENLRDAHYACVKANDASLAEAALIECVNLIFLARRHRLEESERASPETIFDDLLRKSGVEL